jgi:hypothetical protein
MLGAIVNIKLVDYELEDENKFPKLAPENYMCAKLSPDS